MARHADRRSERTRVSPARRIRTALPAVGICLLLIGAILLGVWWWHLRSVTDPIDANPVDAYATVVSSPSCSSGSRTTVRLSGTGPAVTARISGCGFATDQRLAVQYLEGHPTQMRLAGTTTAGSAGLAGKLLPIGILAAGLVAVFAAIALVVERRRSRHLASADRISVADLRSRAGASRREEDRAVTENAGTPSTGGGGAASGSADQTSAAADEDGSDEAAPDTMPGGAAPGGAAPEHSESEPPGASTPDRWRDGPGEPVERIDEGQPSSQEVADMDPGEPAHVLPSGFVIVDEQLFTHSGTEARTDTERSSD